MFCSSCRTEIPDGSTFCHNCGAAVTPAVQGPLPEPGAPRRRSAWRVAALAALAVVGVGILAVLGVVAWAAVVAIFGERDERTVREEPTPAPALIALESSVFLQQAGDITMLGPEGWSVLDVPELGLWVNDMAVDDQGRLWVLGRDSVGLFDGSQLVQYRIGSSMSYFDALAVDSSGRLWVSREHGVNVNVRGDEWVSYDFPIEQGSTINDMAVDGQDRVWVATEEEGVWVLDGGRWSQHDLGLEPLESEEGVSVEAVAIGQDGRVWAGHRKGVSVFDGQRWVTYGPGREADVPDLSSVRDLSIDAEGGVWAVTFPGDAWVFRDGEWARYDRSNSGLLGGAGRAISIDLRGRVWILTDSHLTVFNGVEWGSYTAGNSGFEPSFGRQHMAIPGEGPAVLPEPTGPGVGTVTGRFTRDGEPLPGAEMHVCWSMSPGPFFSGETPCTGEEYVATSGPDGRFSLENVPMGVYNWVTRTPEGEWHALTSYSIPVDFFLDSGETHDLGERKR